MTKPILQRVMTLIETTNVDSVRACAAASILRRLTGTGTEAEKMAGVSGNLKHLTTDEVERVLAAIEALV